MTRTFKVETGPHAPQLCVQAHDLTHEECEIVRDVVLNNWTKSTDYKLGRACGAFLQGYDPPAREGDSDGWALVEFWTNDRNEIDAFVAHLNRRVAAGAELAELVK